MRFADPQSLHKRGNVIGKILGSVGAIEFVRFSRSPKIQGDAGKVFGVLGYLEGVTSVIGGQVGNEQQGLSVSLLVVIHRNVVGFNLGYGRLPGFAATAHVIERSFANPLLSKPHPMREDRRQESVPNTLGGKRKTRAAGMQVVAQKYG